MNNVIRIWPETF